MSSTSSQVFVQSESQGSYEGSKYSSDQTAFKRSLLKEFNNIKTSNQSTSVALHNKLGNEGFGGVCDDQFNKDKENVSTSKVINNINNEDQNNINEGELLIDWTSSENEYIAINNEHEVLTNKNIGTSSKILVREVNATNMNVVRDGHDNENGMLNEENGMNAADTENDNKESISHNGLNNNRGRIDHQNNNSNGPNNQNDFNNGNFPLDPLPDESSSYDEISDDDIGLEELQNNPNWGHIKVYKNKVYKYLKKQFPQEMPVENEEDAQNEEAEEAALYDEEDNEIYIGLGVRVGSLTWTITKSKKDDLFLRAVAVLLWSKINLTNRCMCTKRVLNSISERSPVKLLTPKKLNHFLRIYRDCLVEKRYPEDKIRFCMRKCTRTLSSQIRGLRGKAIEKAKRRIRRAANRRQP